MSQNSNANFSPTEIALMTSADRALALVELTMHINQERFASGDPSERSNAIGEVKDKIHNWAQEVIYLSETDLRAAKKVIIVAQHTADVLIHRRGISPENAGLLISQANILETGLQALEKITPHAFGGRHQPATGQKSGHPGF